MSCGVVASNVSDIGAFNFDLRYDPNVLSSPTILGGDSRDRNPDANQSFLESTGRTFACTPPDPGAAIVAGTQKAARIACTSSGPTSGADATTPQTIASLTFAVVGGSSGSSLSLANVNIFDHSASKEIASCNPTVSVNTVCNTATIATLITPVSVGGIAEQPDVGALAPMTAASAARPAVYAITGVLLAICAAIGAGGWYLRRRRAA